MAWKVEFSEGAKKSLSKFDKQVARRIYDFFKTRLTQLDDPRSIGQGLEGSRLGEFWKYRVGDWRAVCQIQDDRVLILVLRVGHRSKVYKEND